MTDDYENDLTTPPTLDAMHLPVLLPRTVHVLSELAECLAHVGSSRRWQRIVVTRGDLLNTLFNSNFTVSTT